MQKNNSLNLIATKLSLLSETEFQTLGIDGLAYIKPLIDNAGEVTTYAVHAADGSHIATGPDFAVLKAIAAQQNLTTMTVQ